MLIQPQFIPLSFHTSYPVSKDLKPDYDWSWHSATCHLTNGILSTFKPMFDVKMSLTFASSLRVLSLPHHQWLNCPNRTMIHHISVSLPLSLVSNAFVVFNLVIFTSSCATVVFISILLGDHSNIMRTHSIVVSFELWLLQSHPPFKTDTCNLVRSIGEHLPLLFLRLHNCTFF